MKITSLSIQNGYFSNDCGFNGRNASPAFCVQDAPIGTVSLALLLEDRDAFPVSKGFSWVHWTACDIKVFELPENASAAACFPQGLNSYISPQGGERAEDECIGYCGMSPPDCDHVYTLHVYALDCCLGLKTGFMMHEMFRKMRSHVLDEAEISAWYSKTGKIEPALPHLGIGTMMFGKKLSEEEARNVVSFSIEHGITHMDTADSYNNGDSERILGSCIKGRRNKIFLASKIGYAPNSTADPDLSYSSAKKKAENSLRRLGTDYIDLLYLHAPDRNTPIAETLRAVKELLTEGKILSWGVSNYPAWEIAELCHTAWELDMPLPVASQNVFNLLSRRCENELVPMLKSRNMTLVAYNPLAGGLLSGKYSSGSASNNGRLSWNKLYSDRYLNESNMKAIGELEEIARAADMNILELALRWIGSGSTAGSVLLGMSNIGQLCQNLELIERGPLSSDIFESCDEVWKELYGTSPDYFR